MPSKLCYDVLSMCLCQKQRHVPLTQNSPGFPATTNSPPPFISPVCDHTCFGRRLFPVSNDPPTFWLVTGGWQPQIWNWTLNMPNYPSIFRHICVIVWVCGATTFATVYIPPRRHKWGSVDISAAFKVFHSIINTNDCSLGKIWAHLHHNIRTMRACSVLSYFTCGFIPH